MKRVGLLTSGLLVLAAIVTAPASAQAGYFTLRSTAFEDDTPIPARYSAYGDNVSPPLSWSNAPPEAESFALIVDDPDAPMEGGFVHWVIYNIPADAIGLPEGLPADAVLAEPENIAGATQGMQGLGATGYFGPRPPAGSGVHHYNFRVFALHSRPTLPEGLNREQLLAAIEGHVLDETTLVGLYEVK